MAGFWLRVCTAQGVLKIQCGRRNLYTAATQVSPPVLRICRLAHSFTRDICPAVANRHADSPISITSSRTALIRGHFAPLLNRSSEAPLHTLPQPRHAAFLRRDLRQCADYYAHTSSEKTCPRRFVHVGVFCTCVRCPRHIDLTIPGRMAAARAVKDIMKKGRQSRC